MSDTQKSKRECAYRAVDELVKSGMKLGLGTGSTAFFAVERIGLKLQQGQLKDICAVATSFSTLNQCQELGIPVFSMNDSRIGGRLDLAIDGADEVNPERQLIKGGGGAHLLEKIVEYNSEKFYVIIDESKLVDTLNIRFPVPLEVIPEARTTVRRTLEEKGFTVSLRMAKAKAGPVISDSGNQILDIFAPRAEGLAAGGPYDPRLMEEWLACIPGVVESGIFTRPVDGIYLGTADGVVLR